MSGQLPLLQLGQPWGEELEVLPASGHEDQQPNARTNTRKKHLHLDLFWRPRHLRCLLCLAGPRPHSILEVIVNRIIQLPLPLRQRQRVECQRFSLSGSEVFAFPLLNGVLGLEVRQVFEVQAFVLGVEFRGTFFAAVDDGVNVVVDQDTAVTPSVSVSKSSGRGRDKRTTPLHSRSSRRHG